MIAVAQKAFSSPAITSDEQRYAGRGAPTLVRTIAHVDLDAFFASVEQVLQPRLVGRPVVVGGHQDQRGVVMSASYEARAMGIRTAMPLLRAYRICPEAHFVRGHFDRYDEFSRRVFDVCAQFTPLIERTSIDEAYLDLTGVADALLPRRTQDGGAFTPTGASACWPVTVGDRLRAAVRADTGLSVSLGIASNKLIAKVATDFAKPGGLCFVPSGCERDFIAPLALEAVPGIGRRTAEVLAEFRLRTVGDLARVPRDRLVAVFGSAAGESLHRKARGRGSDVMELRTAPRSISRETTFERNTDDRTLLLAVACDLLAHACWKLRRLRMRAQTVSVKLRYGNFRSVAAARSIGLYSDNEHDFRTTVGGLLDRLYSRPALVRLVGIELSNLTTEPGRQMHLWEEDEREQQARLGRAVDRIRQRYGFGAVVSGGSADLLGPPRGDAAPPGLWLAAH